MDLLGGVYCILDVFGEELLLHVVAFLELLEGGVGWNIATRLEV